MIAIGRRSSAVRDASFMGLFFNRLQYLLLPPDTPNRHTVRLSDLIDDTSRQKLGFGYTLIGGGDDVALAAQD
jgi:hypothetical protein